MGRIAARNRPTAVPLGAKGGHSRKRASQLTDLSDVALIELLNELKATDDPSEIRRLSDQIERAVFHKQYDPA